MKKSLLLVGIWCFMLPMVAQEMLLPMGPFFKSNTILSVDKNETHGFVGTGLFPVTEGSVRPVYYLDTTENEGGWFSRKLFQEHFVEITGEDYFISIDPLINLQLGVEEGLEDPRLFQNTRAFQVSGEVMNKVSFYTGFYENQARFATYQMEYFEERGERRFSNTLGDYDTINPVIPAGGRTKPFKEDGVDYAQSMSYVRYRIMNSLAVQLGNTPQFIGWGHRSMLLSDNSFNATTLRVDATFSPKWSYSTLNSKKLNLYRRIKGVENTVEEPFEKKNLSVHYLTYQPTDRLTLGLFEGTMFFREDSVRSEWMHPLYFNPVLGINTLAFGWENEHAKSLLGLNFSYVFGKQNMIYGQFVTDELGDQTEYGVQLGWRSKDLFGVKNLHILAEYNRATERLYAANNQRIAYTHFNLPLAHTLGNGFDEFVIQFSYNFGRTYLATHAVVYQALQPMDQKTHLFTSRSSPTNTAPVTVNYLELESGYIFNPRTNLRFFSKIVYRTSVSETAGDFNSAMIYVGIKTGLFNQYFDF